MDTKELLAIVNSYEFETKKLYRYATVMPEEYELATLLGLEVEEIKEGITLIDYRYDYPHRTLFALYVKEGENYALYIDENDRVLLNMIGCYLI